MSGDFDLEPGGATAELSETDRLIAQHASSGGIRGSFLDDLVTRPRDDERSGLFGRTGGSGSGANGGSGHGAGGNGDASSRSSHVSGQSAPEPTPQRDDPDEGQHTRSEQESDPATVSADAEDEHAAVVDDVAPVTAAETEETAQVVVGDPKIEFDVPFATDEPSLRRLEGEGDAGATFQERTRFTFPQPQSGKSSVQMKTFPVELVDRLREDLARMTNASFAEQISAPAIVTAFLLAQLGFDTEGFDVNTATAVTAFRKLDQRLGALEDGLGVVEARTQFVAKDIDAMKRLMVDLCNVIGRLEHVGAFLVHQRVAPEAFEGMTPSMLDITDDPYLATRARIRATVDRFDNDQRRRAGVPIR